MEQKKMKTNQVLVRKFGKHEIRQYHLTELFNASDIVAIANKKRLKKGKALKDVQEYLRLQDTKETIDEMALQLDCTIEDIVVRKRGRNGGIWVHPYLMIDIAMWSDPSFKVKMLKFVYDNVTFLRDAGGSTFGEVMQKLDDKHSLGKNRSLYASIANKIRLGSGKSTVGWNDATEEQLALRNKIHKNILLLNDYVPYPDVIHEAIIKAQEDIK